MFISLHFWNHMRMSDSGDELKTLFRKIFVQENA